MPIRVVSVVGARPNYMKIAPVLKEIKRYHRQFSVILVHTGQHYDKEMYQLFFDDLDMPLPDINLRVGSASHAKQTADIMVRFEKVLLKKRPDIVIVAGDVNSTLACALTAKKLHIKVAHIEAGLRSYDMRMPEEINRKLTDSISDYLFTPSLDANRNLINEGISKDKIYFVGNVMIDTLIRLKKMAEKQNTMKRCKFNKNEFAILTLHRPENIDNKYSFLSIIDALSEISKEIPILFPAHPRAINKIKEFNLVGRFKSSNDLIYNKNRGIFLLPPLGYLDFINLMMNSRFVLTDSGGIQEETTILKIPCLTLRDNTERPITVRYGGNIIAGTDRKKIIRGFNFIMNNRRQIFRIPKYWDGKAAQRIVDILKKINNRSRKDNQTT